MKTIRYCLAALLVALPAAVFAQGTTNELETDSGARLSVGVDKKLMKGLHLEAGGEVRLSDNFSTLGRYQAELGISYKVSPLLKVGAGYIFIQKKNSENVWKPRHRFYADAMLSLRSGYWRFSLKERLQLTHRTVGNAFQNTPNSLALKSRLKVSYKGFADVTPYAYLELRNVFNDPACSATWSTVSQSYSDYSFLGYKDAYLNRFRGSLGAEWKLTRQHALDIYLLADYCYDKEIDTNAEGTKLKSLTYTPAFNVSLGIGYKFCF